MRVQGAAKDGRDGLGVDVDGASVVRGIGAQAIPAVDEPRMAVPPWVREYEGWAGA